MSNSSILGGDAAATRASGRDTDALGPSDSSDTGSDVQGERTMSTGGDTPDELGSIPVDLGSDSDSSGTGERGAAAGDAAIDGGDIMPDHIVGDESVESDDAFDAGSSDGLDGIEDDIEDDDGEDGGERPAEGTLEAGAGTGGVGSGGKVYTVPPGTLDQADER